MTQTYIPKHFNDVETKRICLQLLQQGERHNVSNFLLRKDNRFFSAEVHAKTFIHYCELLIDRRGRVFYAVPSHQERLIELYALKRNLTIDEARVELEEFDKTQHFVTINGETRHIDAFDKLMLDTGCALIWYDSIKYSRKLTTRQMHTISLLLKYGCVCDSLLADLQVS